MEYSQGPWVEVERRENKITQNKFPRSCPNTPRTGKENNKRLMGILVYVFSIKSRIAR